MTKEELLLQRRRKGLTQAQLASVLGYSRQAVVKWERGTHAIPNDVAAAIIAACLDNVAKPKLSPEDRGTLQAYSKMRRSGDPIFSHHANIVLAWHNAGFTPSREAMAAIAAGWPDILNPTQED